VAARSLTVARRGDDAAALLIALDTNIIAARTFADARGYFEQARALLVGMGDQIIGCQLLHNIGWGALEAGERDYAATAMDDGIALVRRVVEPLRCDDNARLWAQAWDRGAALDYEQAVAAGLGPRGPRPPGAPDSTAGLTGRRPSRLRRRG
jgi:hypothetical protein